MVRRLIPVAAALLALSLTTAGTQGSEEASPEDRVLGPGAEMRLPRSTQALAETLASIARASGVLIGFETMLDAKVETGGTQFGWSLSGKRVGDALRALIELHPEYAWRRANGVIHVRPQTALADRNHFLNEMAAPLELTEALPLQAAFEVHRVFVPDCIVNHPIYTEERDKFLENELPAMRQPVTLSFGGGRVIDLLDAIIKAHGSLSWNVTYQIPPERLHDATPRYEYAIFAFAAYPQVGGWWRMCTGRHDGQ
jgi:hypothetical protein